MMDSTFMGTLAGISLWLGELGESCLSVVNLNEGSVHAESAKKSGVGISQAEVSVQPYASSG